MKKHTLLFSLLAAISSLNVHASNNTYVGGTLSVQDITAAPSAFRGIRGAGFIGYSMSDEKDYYVATELAISIAGTITNYYLFSNDNLRQSPTLSFSVLPGMFLTQTSLGYIRLGIAEASFSGDHKWRPGIILGLGLETALSPCWSVRAEYDYSWYRSMSVGTPRSDEFGLSFKYTFDV